MRIRNFTPHPLNIHFDDGTVWSYPSEGAVRVTEEDDTDDLRDPEIQSPDGSEVRTVPSVRHKYAGLEGMPDPDDLKAGDVLVVSIVVMQYMGNLGAYELGNDRVLLRSPDTGPVGAVRDEDGRIVGTRRLVGV